MNTKLIPALALLAIPGAMSAQVGEPLPQANLTGFTATEAPTLDDYQGRLLLLEFFAYW